MGEVTKPALQAWVPRLWKVLGLSLAGLLISVSPVSAGEGTLALMSGEEWGTPLSDAEMEGIRGGFNGVAFSVFFTGFFDKVGKASGNLFVNTPFPLATPPPPAAVAASPPPVPAPIAASTPIPAPSPTIGVDEGQIRIMTSIGDFKGANGIFQITQVPGSFNVVNNQLFVQIAVVNVMHGAAIPTLNSLFRR